MNILLLSMPDSFEHMPSVAIRMPNGALASLAGNVDPHHTVAIGDLTFRELVRALERGTDLAAVAGLSFNCGEGFTHNPDRPVSGLDDGGVRLPNRGARVLSGYTMVGRQVDVVETSRGCTFDCSFCSIIEMRGRNFHAYDFDRVLADIRDARAHGARAIFLVDDNITLNVRRFEGLCRAIVDAGFE